MARSDTGGPSWPTARTPSSAGSSGPDSSASFCAALRSVGVDALGVGTLGDCDPEPPPGKSEPPGPLGPRMSFGEPGPLGAVGVVGVVGAVVGDGTTARQAPVTAAVPIVG